MSICPRFKLPRKDFMTDMSKEYYDSKLVQLGCEVRGIDLKTENRPEVIERIKQDVTKFRLLIFKDQGVISGDRHVEISKWFGDLESTFYKHPRSPHPDVFRVSNDEEEGCTGVGRTGWHIDGSFQDAPFSYSLYHMVSVPKKGATSFAPLTEIIEGLPKAKREEWDRIWMVSDRRTGPIHPLIYRHPITKKEVLCFHLGMTSEFLYDYGTSNERLASKEETRRILNDIHEEFVKDGGSIQYVHNWEVGDFIISDNLAVGHEATPDTQTPRSKVGLRVLHRTTIKGTVPPAK
uniref:Alpha-ketoglutarate-dependent sulfonate dioxygenase n=1 Tax=Lygus hesperus TaxID=30085 RepID=A0A0A9XNV9_LYGHE